MERGIGMKKMAVFLVVLMAAAFGSAACAGADLSQLLVWQETFAESFGVVPGWQVAEIDGKRGLQYEAYDAKAVIELMFPVQPNHGRIEFMVYQTSGSGSNFGIKPYPKGDPNFIDFWISKSGEARLWRGLDPENPNDVYENGQWHEFAFEWNSSEGTFTVYAKIDGNWVQKWNASGIFQAPFGLYLDGGAGGSGAIGSLRLYDLSK